MQDIYEQFSTIIPYLFILFLGFLSGKFNIIESNSIKTISKITVNVFTPFIILDCLQTPKTKVTSSELIWCVVSAILIFALYFSIAYIFFLRKKNDSSDTYACALCSSGVSILALPLLSKLTGINASVYTAIFIFINQLLFNVFTGKLFYKKRSILKSIINLPFLIGILGIIMYFFDIQFVLPLANTVSYISEIVPTISVLLIGMYFAINPLSKLTFQFDIIIVSAFKLFLFPLLILGICLIAHVSLEIALVFIILSGLPCGIDLNNVILLARKKNISYAANVTAFSFVFSSISIPIMCYITREIYSMVN